MKLKFLKDILLGDGVYDLTQGKIFGPKKYSPVWWHERGHQIRHKSGKFAELQAFVSIFFYGGLMLLTLQKFTEAMYFIGIFIAAILYEELQATYYMFKMRKYWR